MLLPVGARLLGPVPCGVGAALALLLALGGLPAAAGSLSGPILDDGTEARLEDLVQLPASSATPPLARINMLREAPDASGRLFVNDLNGPLYVIDGESLHTYMDFSALFPAFKAAPGLATGFVSFDFHPEFASNGIFYTVHTETVGAVAPNLVPALPIAILQHSVLTEWQAVDPAANSFSGSARELLRVAAGHHFHNLGEIAFDPNAGVGDADYGLLYIGAGDFGCVALGEPDQLQRRDTPYGAILRIDPLGGPFLRGGVRFDYGIPDDNPFAGDTEPGVLGEVYAYGFRNAHRIAWDTAGGEPGPWVSDVGEDNLEEVDRLVAGGNYGWPEREGSYALDVSVDPSALFALPADDAVLGYRYPAAQYDHEEGSAIAGGFVVRDGGASDLDGAFVFGDIVSGRIFYADATALRDADDGDPATQAPVHALTLVRDAQSTTLPEVVAAALGLATVGRVDLRFGRDAAGQLYVMTKQDGFVRRLVPVPEPSRALLCLAGIGVLHGLAQARRRSAAAGAPRLFWRA